MAGVLEKDLLSWLRLIRSENVGPRSFHSLLKIYGTAERALERIQEMSLRGGKKKPIKIGSIRAAHNEIAACKKIAAEIILAKDARYPKLLRHIYDYPPLITVRGNVDLLNAPSIALVGSRDASANGCKFAYHLADALGQNQYIVVSGLARGIDTAAHKGALPYGTVAVVANGIETIYPKQNEALYDHILQTGLIVSEMPYGMAPRPQNFPRRNRIISGLSLGVVVVEAGLHSGSLITAQCALEQNREIFAVPGFPLDIRSRGSHSLLKQGAYLVETVEDITEVFKQHVTHFDRLHASETHDFVDKKMMTFDDQQLDDARSLILRKLSFHPVSVDEIVLQTGLTPNMVLTILLEFELASRLAFYPGHKVSLIY